VAPAPAVHETASAHAALRPTSPLAGRPPTALQIALSPPSDGQVVNRLGDTERRGHAHKFQWPRGCLKQGYETGYQCPGAPLGGPELMLHRPLFSQGWMQQQDPGSQKPRWVSEASPPYGRPCGAALSAQVLVCRARHQEDARGAIGRGSGGGREWQDGEARGGGGRGRGTGRGRVAGGRAPTPSNLLQCTRVVCPCMAPWQPRQFPHSRPSETRSGDVQIAHAWRLDSALSVAMSSKRGLHDTMLTRQ
jgi:hypothetical protein